MGQTIPLASLSLQSPDRATQIPPMIAACLEFRSLQAPANPKPCMPHQGELANKRASQNPFYLAAKGFSSIASPIWMPLSYTSS